MADFLECLSRNRLDSVLGDAARCCSDPSQVSILEVRGPTGFGKRIQLISNSFF